MAEVNVTSDRELLSEVLESTALGDGERQAFEGMADDIASGRRIGLSVRQRDWLLGVALRLGLDDGAQNLVSRGIVKVSDVERRALREFADRLGPRPLKPPGRRCP